MEEQKIVKIGEVKFNLGERQLNLIANLLDEASACYLRGDLIGCFYHLKNVKLQMISRLNDKERKEMVGQENHITFIYTKKEGNWKGRLCKVIEDYDILIKDKLQEKGFLVPSKRDRTALFGQESVEPEPEEEEL